MAGSMATTSNAAMRKKTPFYVSVFLIHDTRMIQKYISNHYMMRASKSDPCRAAVLRLGTYP
jgi:hypothetical protein